MAGFSRYDELMKKLGKHQTGKSCLYVKRLADLDRATLRELIRRSVEHLATKRRDASGWAGANQPPGG